MQLIGICGKKNSGKSSLAKDIKKNLEKSDKKIIIMSMATPLKDFCEDYLGLTHEQVYGTEMEKNSLTSYQWENLPHYEDIIHKIYLEEERKALEDYNKQPFWCRWYEKYSGALEDNILNRVALRAPIGRMTARHVMQEWGTGVFRKINPYFWVNKAKEEIKQDQDNYFPSQSIILDDIRFIQECEMVREYDGILIKLMRGNDIKDQHESECLQYKYDIIVPDHLDRTQTLEYVIKEMNKCGPKKN